MKTHPAPELIVALGAGLVNKAPTDAPYLWIGQETEKRAIAAAKLWQQHQGALLIFSGGRPAGPGTPSEAETMQACVEQEPWNVPRTNILTENESVDTASNVRNVATLMKERGLPSAIILIAGSTNIARAAAYFRAYGIAVVRYAQDTATHKAGLRERLLRMEQFIDRKGLLMTWITRWRLKNQA